MEEQGGALSKDAKILDFGCGAGHKLEALRKEGFDAYGCDVAQRDDLSHDIIETHKLLNDGAIRLIDPDNYRIPFDDAMFDVVISDQVFEHVQDYNAALSEINRVTKNQGRGLHIFPARYRLLPPIEPHIRVPLATFIQSYWWIALWSMIGVRPRKQKSLNWRESTEKNHNFLKNNTNYLRRSEIKRYFENWFDSVKFCGASFAKVSNNNILKTLSNVPLASNIIGHVYVDLKSRVIYTSGVKSR
jgi:ubiquinone/menaquinone biosynthesis C-methylase UbiE